MEKMITFKRPDGNDCSGYYAEPAVGEGAPGVVLIQEWWGLNDQIKAVARRLVGAGYRVLAPDLYRGQVTLDVAEAEHLMHALDFGDAAAQDIRGAVQYLKGGSPKVAVMGFCMGGALTLLAAVHVREADAAVCYYGFPPEAAADVRAIQIPLLGHFAEQDEFFPIAEVDGLEARLKQGGVAYEFHRYAARHAFANETRPNYDAEAATLAWQRTLDFLAMHCFCPPDI
jgi:carboxymethylenebutenolidase